MIPDNKLEWFARSGYAARGAVYALTAGMALLSSFGGGLPDSKSAMQTLLEQPLGQIWLGLIGVGLVGFIVWRLIQAIFNTDHHESDWKGYGTRAVLLVSAATYTSLAAFAIGQAFHLGFGGGSSDGGSSWTSWLMSQPFGRYLVGLLALAVLGSGVAQIIRGAKRSYRKYFERDWGNRKSLDAVCMYGLIARGTIFLIVGVFFLYAAFAVDPQQAGSSADALTWVRQLPFGGLLYVIVALGLFAFGAYGFIEARFRIVNPPTSMQQARRAVSI
ncbi:DUF1206 domain-containing protein [Neorhizobium lilium]|uniref:DUF1206 domain-containing protein n=1 Tax=Neorhizobium lilium TaxID=2503024 RepID=A0A444LHM1_9HYPH|nr:DUF1206 domain-containing protein [Neorhizobium lilium]RWX78560.1 DUF1206 domain-containing protein [Neorhizobium lilium]